MSLAAILVVLLMSAALVVPSASAYATHDNGKGKSHDTKTHQKDRKGSHDDNGKGDHGKKPKRCENGNSKKYNKHCRDD